MSYYNTTKESGTTLKNNVAKANTQDKEVLHYISFNESATPSEVYKVFFQYPITSIRRALTNLTKQGKLIKTDEKRIGMYGRSEFVWKLNENN